MPEGIDPKLYQKYNKELAKAGMPEELEPVVVPRDENLEQIVKEIPELKSSLIKFKAFSFKMRRYISDEMLKLRKRGASKEEIVNRLKLLVEKAQDFTRLDSSDSDRSHHPQLTDDEQEIKDLEAFAEAVAEGEIERGEKIMAKESNKESNKPETLH